MRKLSTGDDSTLGSYRKLSVTLFGADSAAVELLDKKIAESTDGENEEVIIDESQMGHMLASAHMQGEEANDPEAEQKKREAVMVKQRTLIKKCARAAWEAYKIGVGGKAYNGDDLPTWDELLADEGKAEIVQAWLMASDAVLMTAMLDMQDHLKQQSAVMGERG